MIIEESPNMEMNLWKEVAAVRCKNNMEILVHVSCMNIQYTRRDKGLEATIGGFSYSHGIKENLFKLYYNSNLYSSDNFTFSINFSK